MHGKAKPARPCKTPCAHFLRPVRRRAPGGCYDRQRTDFRFCGAYAGLDTAAAAPARQRQPASDRRPNAGPWWAACWIWPRRRTKFLKSTCWTVRPTKAWPGLPAAPQRRAARPGRFFLRPARAHRPFRRNILSRHPARRLHILQISHHYSECGSRPVAFSADGDRPAGSGRGAEAHLHPRAAAQPIHPGAGLLEAGACAAAARPDF